MQTDFVLKCEEFAKSNFSLSELRPAQREVLTQIFEKKFVIATLPTGAGKTLLYSLPALFFKNETVLVISPLISLMRDQERRMSEASISCVVFTSEQSEEERKIAWNKLRNREAKIIFASPERFVLPSFLNALTKINISMAVIDEAHCVVTWGHNFRPEYSEIGKILTKLQPPRILALTATAGRNSRQDIIKRVFPENIQVSEYISKPLAENVFVESHRVYSVDEQWEKLVKIINKSSSQKILVYFQSRILCEEAVRRLRKLKIHSVAYHAGLPKNERRSVEQYVHDTTQKAVICATTAFGMGVDVSGILLVIVFGFPSNIEEFFQMLGRGGRGGEPSRGLLLWTGSDPIKREFQFKSSFPEASLFLELSALFIKFMPNSFSESCFVYKSDLLKVIKTKKEQDKLKKLDNVCAGLRICNALEDTRLGESYLKIKVAAHLTFADVLASLPIGITKRKKVLEGLTSLVEKSWISLLGGQCVISLKMLADASEMNVTSCEQVFLHYGEQKIINFAKIESEHAKQGVILKNGYVHLQKELPRYISARSHFHASLRELDKLSTSATCRLSASFEFFAPRHIQGASKNLWRCMQCDICIRKRME